MSNALPLVVANQKANKNWEEVENWIDEITETVEKFPGTVILCPATPFLKSASVKIQQKSSKLALGAQTVSRFPQGPYTGEFCANQIQDICTYSIVGHSERNKYFGETAEDVIEQIKQLIAANVTPLLCVRNRENLEAYVYKEEIKDHMAKMVFVYEPPAAISNQSEYRPENKQIIKDVTTQMKSILGTAPVLYGGSLNAQNVVDILSITTLDGGLLGQGSLDAKNFAQILTNIQSTLCEVWGSKKKQHPYLKIF